MDSHIFLATPGKFNSLSDYPTQISAETSDKEESEISMKQYIKEMQGLQDMLYAGNTHAVLVIFQAMDGAGKDSTIKHVMSGINPQGCQIYNFKQPSVEELDHDFLWRTTKCLPERGRIGIFNRSYYEEVLIARIHPEILMKQNLPGITTTKTIPQEFWENRYQSINDYEKHLIGNGTEVIKFFLNVSKKEQADRFLKRIDEPGKNWKFAYSDLEERGYWDEYQKAYETMISKTSTTKAPWYIIPADKKWYMRLAVATIILERMKKLELRYPALTEKQIAELAKAREILSQELS
jgi:PPK2 family polyphosphate:nucleotide phosphotransferase